MTVERHVTEVSEPTDGIMSEQAFQRAFAEVLRREAPVFEALAAYDEDH